MKPIQIFAFLLSVGILLFGLQLIVPENVTVSGIDFKVFHWENWLFEAPIKKSTVNARKLQQLQAKTELLANSEVDSTSEFEGLKNHSVQDSLADQQIVDVEFHIDSTSGIQFPAGDSTILDEFFFSLDSARSKKELVRILHFGDSQIEGDRITGYLRQRFQQQFGGCGPGLLPLAEEIPSRFSVEIKTVNQPLRYLNYGKIMPGPHKRYSILHSIFRLQPDSNNLQKIISQRFNYRLRRKGFQKATYFEQASLIFQNPFSPVEIEFIQTTKESDVVEIKQSDSLRIVEFLPASKQNSLSLKIKSQTNNDFYGVCLDCSSGVAVDNIPLRGSSGMELLKINPKFLRDQISQMNTKLVILQFGVNVVPYESAGYSWYESALVKAVNSMKRAAPDVKFLIIGVSDMAQKRDGQWQSYSNIEAVRAAQKNIAKKTNSAYWDLYDVMGGPNSIIAWASTEPPLAGKDYIHLTPKGAQVVGEFLFQALNKVNTRRGKKWINF